MAEVIIDVRDVEKTYKMGKMEVRALRGVSLDIRHGEFVAIMHEDAVGEELAIVFDRDVEDVSPTIQSFHGNDCRRGKRECRAGRKIWRWRACSRRVSCNERS